MILSFIFTPEQIDNNFSKDIKIVHDILGKRRSQGAGGRIECLRILKSPILLIIRMIEIFYHSIKQLIYQHTSNLIPSQQERFTKR